MQVKIRWLKEINFQKDTAKLKAQNELNKKLLIIEAQRLPTHKDKDYCQTPTLLTLFPPRNNNNNNDYEP